MKILSDAIRKKWPYIDNIIIIRKYLKKLIDLISSREHFKHRSIIIFAGKVRAIWKREIS
jgi:hypothetical protein